MEAMKWRKEQVMSFLKLHEDNKNITYSCPKRKIQELRTQKIKKECLKNQSVHIQFVACFQTCWKITTTRWRFWEKLCRKGMSHLKKSYTVWFLLELVEIWRHILSNVKVRFSGELEKASYARYIGNVNDQHQQVLDDELVKSKLPLPQHILKLPHI